MKILAFETSSRFLSVAVLDSEELLSNFHKDVGLNHSSLLIPTIDRVLKHAHLKLKDMDAIALGIGPGSFTGLRIGVSTAKALSIATGIPIISVSSLDVIAYNYIKEDSYIAPLLDAKKNKVYSAFYKADFGEVNRISEYLLVSINDVLARIMGPTLFFGDALALYGKYMVEKSPLAKISKDTNWYPKAQVVGKFALEKFRKGYTEDIDKLVPMYLHPKECNVRGFKY